MKKTLLIVATTSVLAAHASTAATTLQEWNFTEDGGGLANNVSEQGLNSTFFDSPDPTAFDGGVTVTRGNGFSGDRLLGLALTDANAASVTISVTMASYDFSAGTGETFFGVRLRNDAGNTTIGELKFQEQDANDRIRFLGTDTGAGGVHGVALATDIGGPITYGFTLDFVNDTYTSWIGTPTSDGSTWENRFAAHTGSIAGLGDTTDDIDSIQWTMGNTSPSTDPFVLDQVLVSYVAVPEPSSTALLGLGGLALILRRRK